MSKLKKKFGRRILAYLLSGAMIMSSLTSSNMTVFASEASSDTGGKYNYEETSDADDANADNAEEKAEADEVLRDGDNTSDEKEDVKESSDEAVEESKEKDSEQTSEAKSSDEEQASETKSFLSTEKEEIEDDWKEDLKNDDSRSAKAAEQKEWDFRKYAESHTDAEAQKTPITEWDGLTITSGKYHGTNYGFTTTGGVITVPVGGDCTVSVLVGYTWEFGFGSKTDSYVVTSDTKDTTYTYPYIGESGTVTISTGSNTSTYIKKIAVDPIPNGKYAIKIAESENGTAAASTAVASSGDTVTLTAEPALGYKVEKWEVTSPTSDAPAIITDENDPNKATFTMPASHVEISVTFVEDTAAVYDIHVLENGYHGTASLKAGQGTGVAKETEITLANVVEATAEEGYTFKEWYVTKTADNTTTNITVTDGKFIMPAGDVYVIPRFTGAAKDKYLYNFRTPQDKTDRSKNLQLKDFGIITFDGFADNDNAHGFYTDKENAKMTLTLSDKATVTVETCCYNSVSTGMTAAIGETSYTPTEEDTTEKNNNNVPGKIYTVETDKAGDLVLTFATENNYIHNIKVEYSKTLDFGNKYFKGIDFTTLTGLSKNDDISNANIDGLLVSADSAVIKYWDEQHGAVTTKNSDTILLLNLEKKANIEILGCCFGSSTAITASSTTEAGKKTLKVATEEGVVENEEQRNPPMYTILDAEGVVTVKFTQQEYIHKITVTDLAADAKEQYFVTVTNSDAMKEMGTVTADKLYCETGKSVTLTVEPVSERYRIKEWKVTRPENANISFNKDPNNANLYTFNMPENDVEIEPVFEEATYNITIDNTDSNGTVSSTEKTTAVVGDTVRLVDVVTYEATGYELEKWIVTDSENTEVEVIGDISSGYEFIMPDSDVTISAAFKKLGNNYNLTITADADITNGTAEPVNGRTIQVPAGKLVDFDQVATAVPAPDTSYFLDYWKVAYTLNGEEQIIKATKNDSGKYIFEMPESDVTVTPIFVLKYKINIATSGIENGTVTAKSQEQQYAAQGDKVLLKDIAEATPETGYVFKEWKVTYHDQSGIESTAGVTPNDDGDDVFTMPDSNVTISAVFEPVVENNFKVWLDDLADENGTVAAEAHSYQGGIVTLIGKDSTQFTKELQGAQNVERDGETHNGYKAGSRHASANDIPSIPTAGDGCCVVFEAKAAGMFNMYFWSTSFLRVWDFDTESGTRNGYKDSETAADFYAFDVVPGHTYVMSTTGKTNNMAYIGYQFIQNVDIEAEISLNNVDAAESALETLELTLTDTAFGTEKAVVKKDTKTIKLLKNHTYKITSNDGSVKAEVGGKDTFTVTSGDRITFDLYNVSNETLTGEITGTAAGTVTSLKFVNMVNDNEFQAVITGTTYSCEMKPGEYDAVVETTNGGKTYDRVSVKPDAENVNEVYVEVPDPSKVRVYAPADIVKLEQTGLKLRSDNGGDVAGSAGAKITVPVTGKAAVAIETYYKASYTVNGKTYTNTSNSTNSNQSDEMMVEGDFDIEVTGETYFRKITVSPVTAFKSELDVPGDYDTLNEAFDAIASMENRPEGEEGRVTVNLNKDIREQTVLRAPYVTLKGNNHTIDWYYGVGTLYYSVDPSTGLYSERLARDRYSSAEGDGQLWGGAFLVYGDHFIAEDTTFKNTYNYELTNEEKTDIAGSTLSVSRLASDADVAASAYKERSNAFYIGADQIECYNCKILSSQDTLGLNGTAGREYHVYFKDCVIGGNVDYVCGDFAAVFDNCELQWKTLSDKGNDKVGYIVAPKTKPYVFRNCKVTVDKNVEGVSGYYGRTWGDGSNASFINTETNGYIKTEGWGEMSSGQGATAVFKEYGNTSGGAPFASTGSFCPAENQTSEAVQDYIDTDTVSITETVLGGWKPGHYSYEPDRKDPENPDTPESAETPESTTTPEGPETNPSESAPEGSEAAPSESTPAPSETTPEGSETAPSESVPEESETNPSESEPEPGETDDDKITSDVKNISISDTERVSIKAANLIATNKPQYAVIVTCTYVDKDGKTDQHQLIEGVHYRVSLAKGSDGKSVGTQEIVISGTGEDTDFGRFIGKETVSYEILSKSNANKNKNIAKLKLRLNKTDVRNATYTGKAITPRVEGLNGLDSSDYTFEYKNNVNAGKASVIVLGTGDYYGKKELTFSIKKTDMSKIEVPTASNVDIKRVRAKNYVAEEKDGTSTELVYKGSPITLEDLTLAIDNVKLRWREDYTVTYSNNAKIGTATATIKGVNNLSGTIKITYTIVRMDSDVIDDVFEDTADNPLPVEYSSKGAKLTSITIGDAVLKENKDYKVTYSKASKSKNIEVGDEFDVKVTGKGSYKNVFKNETVHIVTVPGNYYARANAVVDASKLKGNQTKDMQTIINAAKITDAAGVKVRANDLEEIEIIDNATIRVIPKDKVNYNETELTCHVARKLSSVKTVGTGIVKYFDGANSVTLTREEIAKTLQGVEEDDIRIMSYRNNNRVGTATVTIEGTSTSIYYGTRNIKFTIKPYKNKPEFGPEGSASEESSTEESSGSTEESSTEAGSTEESSVEASSMEESSVEGSSTEESSETESSTVEPEKPTEAKEKTLWIVGDSTVCSFSDAYYYPRYGYGTQIENYETGYYEVKNLAMSGRSSKSYLTDEGSKPLYEQLTAGISAGDVLIIGFGHNDEKAEAERYTNPNGSYTTEGSFAKSLYDNYVKVALDAGATPIVCTPIVRRNASGTLSDADCHITKDATGYPGGDYAKAIRDLGTAVNVPVVDLTALTKALYTELGAEGTLKLHSWTSDQPGSVDNTHLNIYGAKKVAYMLAKEIQAQKIEGVSNHFWTGAEPTEADDLKSNPDYVPPVYDNDLKQSELWQDYGVFKGTVFGTVGSDMSFYSVGTDTDGSMRLKASGNKSKVASGEDGFAMYYYKVPVGKNFSISAKAKLNTIPTGADVNQVAFGLMARDDMYIDSAKGVELTSAITSDYVVAGSLGADKNGNWTNCFKRKNGKLEKGSNLAAGKIVKDGVYDLNITSNTDGYAVTFDTEGTLSGGFDYQLTAVDSQYVYVGMFVSRNADVSFTDINLIVDGETIVGDDKPADDDKELAKYNMEGFAAAADVTGGGTLKEGDTGYYKAANEKQFFDALKTAAERSKTGAATVIEITAEELNLGDKENSDLGIVLDGSGEYSGVVRAYKAEQQPKWHPTLKKTGVSCIKMNGFKNVTIFSQNGAMIKHAGIIIEGSSKNIIFRNLTFDEFWEWDEGGTIDGKTKKPGDYDINDWDYMSIDDKSDSIWIDHCTFYKAYDGVIDVKRGETNQRVTISWCEFLPGSKGDTFFDEQIDWLETNKADTTYYKQLRDEDSLTKADVRTYAYGQKKTHLFGHDDDDYTSEVIKVTLANNYYKNSMDRLPRLRRGIVHEYNCILDSSEIYGKKKVTSNGAISTCDGQMLLENCYINGIKRPLMSGNSSSPRGYINAINSVYYLDGKKTELKPESNATGQTEALVTDATQFKENLQYNSYNTYDAESLTSTVMPNAGAGKLTLTAEQWVKTQY